MNDIRNIDITSRITLLLLERNSITKCVHKPIYIKKPVI